MKVGSANARAEILEIGTGKDADYQLEGDMEAEFSSFNYRCGDCGMLIATTQEKLFQWLDDNCMLNGDTLDGN